MSPCQGKIIQIPLQYRRVHAQAETAGIIRVQLDNIVGRIFRIGITVSPELVAQGKIIDIDKAEARMCTKRDPSGTGQIIVVIELIEIIRYLYGRNNRVMDIAGPETEKRTKPDGDLTSGGRNLQHCQEHQD